MITHVRPANSTSRARHAVRWVAALAASLVATAAVAQGPLKAITGGLESGTDLVTLPGTASGTLSARECSNGCPTHRLRFDRNTRFFIGKDVVPYARFREVATKDDLTLYVSYRLSDNTLTRLRIPAAVKP